MVKNEKSALKTMLKRFCIVVVFGIAFGYIEAAVVVYLRTIFHPEGFSFPLATFGTTSLWRQLLLTEIGREAATLALIFTGVWLSGKNRQQRFAYFMVIFAVWDIFYYIWLKILINWPSEITDWDILFLIPTPWAGPFLAPILISITLLVFAAIILYHDSCGKAIKVSPFEWLGFILAGLIVVISFCIAGLHIQKQDFQDHFYWSLFFLGYLLAIFIFIKCCFVSARAKPMPEDAPCSAS